MASAIEKRREFAQWLREKRKAAGLSHIELSQKLSYNTHGTIAAVETARGPLPIEKIDALAEALGVDVEKLLLKLEECEPELYAKYRAVEKGILRRFMGQLLGKGTSGSIGLKDLIPALFLASTLSFWPLVSNAETTPDLTRKVDNNISYQKLRRLARKMHLYLAGIWSPYDPVAGNPVFCA